MSPKQMEALRVATADILADGPLTREELVAAFTARRGLRHVADGLRSGW